MEDYETTVTRARALAEPMREFINGAGHYDVAFLMHVRSLARKVELEAGNRIDQWEAEHRQEDFTQCEDGKCGSCDGCVNAGDDRFHQLRDEGLI